MGKWLSKERKEVLIQYILLVLLTYVMCSFLFPLKIYKNLENAITNSWGAQNLLERKIHLAKWKKKTMFIK